MMNKSEGSKRKRSSNFRLDEVEVLVELVCKRGYIVECKETNGQTWKEKARAWKEMESDFAAATGTFRPLTVLKHKYELLKRDIRKKTTAILQLTGKNGVGAVIPENLALTPVEAKLKSIMGDNYDSWDGAVDSDSFIPENNVCVKLEQDMTESQDDLSILDAEMLRQNSQRWLGSFPPDHSSSFQPEVTNHQPNFSVTANQNAPTYYHHNNNNVSNNNCSVLPKANIPPARPSTPPSLSSLLNRKKGKVSTISKYDKLAEAKLELVRLDLEMKQSERKHRQKLYEAELKQEALKTELLQLELEIKRKQLHSM